MQTREEGEPPNPRHVYAAKARLRRLVPLGDVLAEVRKTLQALVEWTTQHWTRHHLNQTVGAVSRPLAPWTRTSRG